VPPGARAGGGCGATWCRRGLPFGLVLAKHREVTPPLCLPLALAPGLTRGDWCTLGGPVAAWRRARDSPLAAAVLLVPLLPLRSLGGGLALPPPPLAFSPAPGFPLLPPSQGSPRCNPLPTACASVPRGLPPGAALLGPDPTPGVPRALGRWPGPLGWLLKDAWAAACRTPQTRGLELQRERTRTGTGVGIT